MPPVRFEPAIPTASGYGPGGQWDRPSWSILLVKYYWVDKITEGKMGGPCCMQKEKNVFYNRILVGKPEGKRPIGRSTRKWEHNTRTDINPLNAELNTICHLLILLGDLTFEYVHRKYIPIYIQQDAR
jgi:hypothetical protein